MPEVVVKLFRELEDAKKVIEQLKSKGYRDEEIGILTVDKGDRGEFAPDVKPEAKGVSLAVVGPVVARGVTASAVKGAEPEAALAQLWCIPQETFNYYQFGLGLGGIVVSVQAEGDRAEEARKLFRAAGGAGERAPMWNTCPAFNAASRMSATNPIDAPMSGDFRRY